IQLRHRILLAQHYHLGQRIGDLAALHHFAQFAHFQRVAAEAVDAARGHADDRIATEALTALDRFEQIGIRAVGELQVDRKRRVQVGQYFTDDGDEIVQGCAMAFSGQLLELLLRDQDGFPSGNRRWRYRRRQRATIATSRSEEHTSELQSRENLVCRLLLEKKKNTEIETAQHEQQTTTMSETTAQTNQTD